MTTLSLGTLVVTLEAESGKYKAELQQAGNAAKSLEKTVDTASKQGRRSLVEYGKELAKMGATLGVVAFAAKQAWDTIGEGAALELAESRFDKLAASIGSTSDAMLSELRTATAGMISDANLMASASQIISLGLMDTEDGVVRLARVVGELGWDMNQVILTFANNSKMRLDALGLSISDVDERTKKFVAAGYAIEDAFDMAVLEAGEARLKLLGSAADTAVGDIKRMEAAWQNMSDSFKQGLAEAVAPALDRLDHIDQIRAKLLELRDAGEITANEFKRGWSISTSAVWAGTDALDRYMLSLRPVIEEEWAARDAAMAKVLALGKVNTTTAEATTQIGLMEAGERELTYTTQAAVSAGEARAEALAAEAEALRLAEEAAHQLAVAYASEFMTALNMADDETVNFTNTMLAAAAQGGANAETLALLAAATGEYSEEQIRAALETAAMTQKAQELGAEIAAGNIMVGEALLQFQDFRAELEQAVVPEVDTSDVAAAIEEAERLRAALEAASGNWTATFNIVQSGGVPPGVPAVPVGAQPAFQHGGIITGGIPGRDSVPILAMPGEVVLPTSLTMSYPGGPEMLFRDLMRGDAAGGSGDTNYYISLVVDGRRSDLPAGKDDAEPFLAAARRLGVPV